MSEILMFIGLGIFILGGIAFLIAAFRTSVLWGFSCLFIAPVQIIYLVGHWDDAKKPFFIQIVGAAVMCVSAYTQGMLQV
jgi:hypothetical protein